MHIAERPLPAPQQRRRAAAPPPMPFHHRQPPSHDRTDRPSHRPCSGNRVSLSVSLGAVLGVSSGDSPAMSLMGGHEAPTL